jgi:uncharacterized membrane protein YpjA
MDRRIIHYARATAMTLCLSISAPFMAIHDLLDNARYSTHMTQISMGDLWDQFKDNISYIWDTRIGSDGPS